MDRDINWALQPVGPFGNPNCIELTPGLPDQMRPFTLLCKWAELLACISAWALPPAGMRFTKIFVLISVSSHSFPQPLADPWWSSSTYIPSDVHEVRLKWTSWEASFDTEKAGCPPWAFFFLLEKLWDLRGAILLWHCASIGEGQCSQSVILLLFKCSFGFYHSRRFFSFTPGFWDFQKGILSMHSCWLVCDGNYVGKKIILPSCWHQFLQFYHKQVLTQDWTLHLEKHKMKYSYYFYV